MNPSEAIGSGILYLCATPIGNLEDITYRVLRVLREVDLIAAEDTRHTRKLLSHYQIHTPLTSYFEHNKVEKGAYLLRKLQEGTSIALVSDAGMPGISDPGYELVVGAIEAGITVVPVPGPSAILAALVVSGLPTDRFVFEGFLPRRKMERQRRLEVLKEEPRTIVLFEAPHRLVSLLEAIRENWGERRLAVVRELTKKFEGVQRGTTSELLQYFSVNPPRGEITLVIQGFATAAAPAALPTDPGQQVAALEAQGLTRKEAIKEAARLLGRPKREVYRAVLQAEGELDE